MEEITTYFKKQLAKVHPDTNTSNYDVLIKIFAQGNGEDTDKLVLCKKSAIDIVEWLQKNYIDK
jgi:hypothetical protein